MIVLLLMDGLGYDYLSETNSPFWKSHSKPIMNSIPTVTSPNFLTILSGKTPQETGVLDNKIFAKKHYMFPYTTIFDDVKGKSVFVSDWEMFRKVSEKPKFIFGNPWKFSKYEKYDLIVLNYQRLDALGHSYGWNSPKYQTCVKYVDKQTQLIYEQLEQFGKPFVLWGCADHGGHGKDHEEEHEPSIRRVPLLFATNTKLKAPKIKHTYQIRDALLSMH